MTRIEQLEQKVKRLEQKICCKTQFFDTVDDLPTEGSTGVIYVTEDGNIYVWNGVEYVLNGLGDAYYTNSYVERLKALGSNILFSTALGGSNQSTTGTSQTLFLNSVYINKESLITGISTQQTVLGDFTPNNYNGVGIYSFDVATTTYTLISSSVDDPNLWKTTTGVISKNLSSPILLQSGVYFIAILHNASATVAPPSFGIANSVVSSSVNTNLTLPSNTYMSAFSSGQLTLPNTLLGSDTTAIGTILQWLY